MDQANRPAIVAGNWKMNLTRPAANRLIKELRPLVTGKSCEVIVCVPFTDIETALKAAKASSIHIGAQNCHWEPSGAFTGEISAPMLSELGVEYVIVGHSERRRYFAETDETVAKRLGAVVENGMTAILCVGETLAEREDRAAGEVIHRQVTKALDGVSAKQLGRLVIAYEPVWAIGTGKTATAEEASETCGFIRGLLAGLYGEEAAYGVSILYGGSMNPKNAGELLSQYDIDGGLIGGASLKAADFSQIVCEASK